MTQPGSINNSTPPSPASIVRRIEALERAQRESNAAQSLGNATIGQGGLKVANGGAFQVLDPTSGNVVFFVGSAQIPDGSGRQQMIVQIFRDDGSSAFYMGDFGTIPGHAHQQNWVLSDRAGNVAFADDTISGQGIAVPYIPFGPFMSNSFPTDTTTSNTYTTLQTAIGYKMNPKVYLQLLVRASDGTTAGTVRVIDQDGNPVGSAQTIPAGAYQYINIGPVALAGNFKDPISLNIQAARSAGTGTIGVRGIGALGIQS